jgi:hypothetical protein
MSADGVFAAAVRSMAGSLPLHPTTSLSHSSIGGGAVRRSTSPDKSPEKLLIAEKREQTTFRIFTIGNYHCEGARIAQARGRVCSPLSDNTTAVRLAPR